MPTSVYRCENRECPRFGEDRPVACTEVGDGLHTDPAVRCTCGIVPRQVARFQPDSPAAPERAVRTQPEKRARRATPKAGD